MPQAPKRILIVDDHAIVRRGLRQLIEDEPGFAVCGEAEGAGEVLSGVAEKQPDLVLLDITLAGGGLNGIEITKQLRAHYPDLPVLILSMHDEALYAARALQAGARGYVMKRSSNEEIAEALQTVLGGRTYVSKAVEGRLHSFEAGTPAEASEPVDRLSDRELEVFRWIGEGLPPRDIAERLSLSVKTVETHRRRIRQKLNLEDATELSRYAVQWHKDRASTA